MPDLLTPAQRHRCMSHIRSRNTKPELKVRQWLWKHGYRYRLCVKSVPGKPDIVMRKYRTAIFVNGCFWHGHGVELPPFVETGHGVETRCSTSLQQIQSQPSAINSPCCKIPQTNRDFWVNKIRRNQERDQRNYRILQENGWQVIVVWEFPGGKIEPGETPEQALKREIWEELETKISVGERLHTVEWDYPKFHLTMHCYLCHIESGNLTLKEHEAAKWLSKKELESVQWLPADWKVIEMLKIILQPEN